MARLVGRTTHQATRRMTSEARQGPGGARMAPSSHLARAAGPVSRKAKDLGRRAALGGPVRGVPTAYPVYGSQNSTLLLDWQAPGMR